MNINNMKLTDSKNRDTDSLEETFIKTALFGIIGSIILTFVILAIWQFIAMVSVLIFSYSFLKMGDNAMSKDKNNMVEFKENVKERYKNNNITDEELEMILDKKIKNNNNNKSNRQKQFNKQ